MKSVAQQLDIEELISEIKGLIQPSSPKNSTEGPVQFKSPIHGDWKNLGDFNLSMKRHHGGTGHSGVDMSTSGGSPVYSMGPGTVTSVGENNSGGNTVGVQHPNNIWTYYAHLATITVQEGDQVDSETVIGTVGNSGNARSSWPHLHFGVKVNGSWVNPSRFFSIPPYDQDFAKNPQKFQSRWVSDQAKDDAKSFNLAQHKGMNSTPTSLAEEVRSIDTILKLAANFEKLAND